MNPCELTLRDWITGSFFRGLQEDSHIINLVYWHVKSSFYSALDFCCIGALDVAILTVYSSVLTYLNWIVSVDISKVCSNNCQKSSSINGSSSWRVAGHRSTDIKDEAISSNETELLVSNGDLELAAVGSSEQGDKSFGIIINIYDVEISDIATIGGACSIDG